MKKIFSLLSLCLCLQLTGNEITSWTSPPEVISTLGVDASSPETAIDESGNAVAVWLEGGFVISKNRPVGGDWGVSTQLSATDTASDPHVALDPSGNVTALWVENGVINTASQPFGSSWGSVTTLSGSSSSSPRITVDSTTGDAIAIWVTSGVVQSATQLFGSSWPGSPDILSASNSAAPQVSISSGGAVIAIWHTLNGVSSLYNINIATKTTLSGSWSAASIISDPGMNSVYPQVAIDAGGDTYAIWWSYNLSGLSYSNVTLQGASFLDGKPWSTPVNISSPGERNPVDLSAKVKCNETGAIALWSNSYNGSSFRIETASTDHNQTWTPTLVLLTTLYSLGISMDTNSEGDVFALYMNYDTPSSSFFINEIETHIGGYLDGSWENATTISTGIINGYPYIAPVLVGAANNYASAVWTGYNGSNNVILSSFGSGAVINPPSNVAITQSGNNFNIFQEYVNTVTWDASSDPTLAGYGIYRNGVYVTFIRADTLQFLDDNQIQNGPITYGVSAIDTSGTESLLISASFP